MPDIIVPAFFLGAREIEGRSMTAMELERTVGKKDRGQSHTAVDAIDAEGLSIGQPEAHQTKRDHDIFNAV